jgi:hypothetical protein
MAEAQEKGIPAVPAWLALAITVGGSLCTGAAAWGANQSKAAEQDRRLDRVESAVSTIYDIRDRLARIEGKLDRNK